jgi:hypothetical protein
MFRVIRIELLKAARRRLNLVLLLVVCALSGGAYGLAFLLWSRGMAIQGASGRALSSSEVLGIFSFPASALGSLDVSRQVMVWLAIVMTATTVGMEDSCGTLRLVFAAGVRRQSYLGAKLLTLGLAELVVLLAGALSGTLAATALWWAAGHGASAVVQDPGGSVVRLLLASSATLAFPTALTFFATVAARSQVTGVAVGAAWYVLESVAGQALTIAGHLPTYAQAALPGADGEVLLRAAHRTGIVSPAGGPSWEIALLVVLCYVAALLAAAAVLVSRRDVGRGGPA